MPDMEIRDWGCCTRLLMYRRVLIVMIAGGAESSQFTTWLGDFAA